MSPFALFSLRRTLLIAVAFFLLPIPGMNDTASQALAAASPTPRILPALAGLPLSFEPNLGQVDPRVKFLSRRRGYTLFLTGDQAILRIQRREAKSENELVDLRLAGAKPDAEVTGRDELQGKVNYFLGNDPKKWRTNLPTYAKVRYHNVYPGVDLEYYGSPSSHGQLEYDFIVAPGADPSAIALRVGAVREPPLRIDAHGDITIRANRGEILFHKPLIYQAGGGSSPGTDRGTRVQGRYILDARNQIRFRLGPYDRSKPLVIDPVLSYSTFLGGSDMDYANGIAVDASGNAYVAGYTASVDFPVVNAAQSTPGGGSCLEDGTATPCFDAFVSKLNSTGTALIYSTYLGGSDEDYGAAIAVDSSGDAYVAGYTYSTNFPVQNALQPNNAGGVDAFVAELSPNGASLVYSTYWGGSLDDVGTGIAVDSNDNAYLSGYTESTEFPVTSGALQTTYANGAHNGFVVKFNSGGTQVGYSTYLGGSGDDYIYAGAVDSAGDAYVTGATNSTNFPTLNAFQPKFSGGQCGGNTFPCFDAFAAKLNPAGSALLFSTYLGGTGSDYGYAIALDRSANAYITGYTTSKNFPTTSGAFEQAFGGGYDVFVTELHSSGSTLGYSTYLGGSGTQVAYGIAVDSNGSAYMTGYNYGGNFPTANPLQGRNAGYYDAFVSVLNPAGSSLVFSTYLGGTQDDFGRGIALGTSGNVYVVGATFSTDFPTTPGSFQPSYMGGPYDAFVTVYKAPAMSLVALSPISYNFGNQALGTASSPQAIDLSSNGGAVLTISSITASGDFSQTNNCGSSLAPGASCTISAVFTPTATGPRTGSITVTDNASPATQSISLTGTGTGPLASLAAGSLTFSSQPVGTSSSVQNLTLSNTGSATLTISSLAISGDFSQTNTCGASLAASSSCTISVTFTPTATGSRTGSITVTDNANPATQTASLSGTGTASAASLSPTSLTFASQALGTGSSAQNVTLSNPGSAPLTVSSVTASGDFSQTNTCGASLAASSSCTISVTFTPTATGSRTGSITVTDNANPATQTASLSGTGTASAASLSPTSLTFASQALGTGSSAQNVTLSNPGSAPLTISSVTASGDFSQTNTCGASLAASSSCTISVTFTPTATGSRTGSITVTDNANPATQTASLSGTGTASAASLSPTSLTFASQALGTGSSAQNVTLSNPGSAPLTVSSVTASGDFSETNTCGASLAASSSCTISVTFTPTATGSRTGSITVTDNANPATQSASLSGTGTVPAASLSPSSLTFASEALGVSSSSQILTLSNTGSATLNIASISISGDFSLVASCGSSVASGASCSIAVTFKPTGTGLRTGTLIITDNASPSTQAASLAGAGAGAGATLSPSSLTFAAEPVGTSSSPQSVTLKNSGTSTLAISGIVASGDFSQTHTCALYLVAGGSCTISVTFKPTASGTRTGALSVSDNAVPSTQTVNLTGGGGGPVVSLSPASLTFGSQAVGSSGNSSQSVTLTNTGSATLAITSVSISGDFSQTSTCGSSMAAGVSCVISVVFEPTASGTRSGTLTITDNASPSTQTVNLTGTGVGAGGPAVNVSPASLTFASQAVGKSSSPQSFTLTNSGSVTLTITSIAISGDFSQTNTCGASVAAGASCSVIVTFKPSTSGTRTGTVTMADNASPATQTVSLAGTGGGPAVNLNPSSLAFLAQKVMTSSRAQTVSLTNTGTALLSISSIVASAGFSQTSNCSPTVAAGASCSISVIFRPTAAGTGTGALTITDNATPTTQTVTLTGTGTGNTIVRFSPATLTFSHQTVGTISGVQSVTLTNTGGAALSIASVAASGDASQTNDCGSNVAVDSSCTISVTFNPSAGGTRTGTIAFTDTAEGSPQTITLTGTGEDFTFAAPSAGSTPAVSPGGTATYSLSAVALGGFNQQVAFACAGAPAGASCTASPASTNISSTASLTVSVVTEASGLPRHNPLPRPPEPQPWLLWAMALLASASFAHAVHGREIGEKGGRTAKAAFGALVLAMLALAACGGGASAPAPQPVNSGTPAGTYSLAVTGTCTSCSTPLSHAITLTLTVR